MGRGDCDIVIVGSGFGGAVCALRAAQAGLRVLVLERGQRLTADLYARLAEGRAPVFYSEREPGPLELHRLSGLIGLTASAVGGGSNVYTAVTVRAPGEAFDDRWPADISRETLEPYYQVVEQMIRPSPIPLALPRTAALEAIARQIGGIPTRLPLAMQWPEDHQALCAEPLVEGVYQELAAWLQGGRAARKRTLCDHYLACAEAAGAEVRPLHEVCAVTRLGDGYRVNFDEVQEATRVSGHVIAPRVVVAAGAINTVRLLLWCRDVGRTLPKLSPALGRRFFTNGDFGGLLIGSRLPLAPDAGPPVTAWLDFWDTQRLYLMETGLVPFDFGSFTGLLNPARWFGAMRLVPAARCTWSFGTMGHDANPGQLYLGRREAMAHRWNAEASSAFRAETLAALRALAEAAGAKLLVPPAVFARRMPITVHPLGGAVMADSPAAGVTDAWGEVFGHPGLYVADGSLIPSPTGVPPSMTIAALAERVAEHLTGRRVVG